MYLTGSFTIIYKILKELEELFVKTKTAGQIRKSIVMPQAVKSMLSA
jgi:hypothetical protein